jgi:hypothetical protein
VGEVARPVDRERLVVRHAGDEVGEDQVEREADAGADDGVVGGAAEHGGGVEHGVDDRVGRVDEGHVEVEADDAHGADPRAPRSRAGRRLP